MKEIDVLRKKIDKIDYQINLLIKKRFSIAEKILSEHAHKDVKTDDIVVVDVDVVMAQDGTGPLAVSQIKKMGFTKVSH